MPSPPLSGLSLLAAYIFMLPLTVLGQSPGREVHSSDTSSEAFQGLLILGEGWILVSEGHQSLQGPATNWRGELFFNDLIESKTYRLDTNGRVEAFVEESGKGEGQAFGPDGRLYSVAGGENKIVAYNLDGSMEVIAEGFRGKDLIVRNDGKIYVTEPAWKEKDLSQLWLITPEGRRSVVDQGLSFPSSIALSPDQSQLYVADTKSLWVYRYQIQPNGLLAHKQQLFKLVVTDAADGEGAAGLEVDREGRLYVAMRSGIQVIDSEGRAQCMLPPPSGKVANLAFGGVEGDILYACGCDKIFKRKLRAHGVQSFAPPVLSRKINGG